MPVVAGTKNRNIDYMYLASDCAAAGVFVRRIDAPLRKCAGKCHFSVFRLFFFAWGDVDDGICCGKTSNLLCFSFFISCIFYHLWLHVLVRNIKLKRRWAQKIVIFLVFCVVLIQVIIDFRNFSALWADSHWLLLGGWIGGGGSESARLCARWRRGQWRVSDPRVAFCFGFVVVTLVGGTSLKLCSSCCRGP